MPNNFFLNFSSNKTNQYKQSLFVLNDSDDKFFYKHKIIKNI